MPAHEAIIGHVAAALPNVQQQMTMLRIMKF
jgi:hypothetical protein